MARFGWGGWEGEMARDSIDLLWITQTQTQTLILKNRTGRVGLILSFLKNQHLHFFALEASLSFRHRKPRFAGAFVVSSSTWSTGSHSHLSRSCVMVR